MRVMVSLAMTVVSATSLLSSPELVVKNVLVVDGVAQGGLFDGYFSNSDPVCSSSPSLGRGGGVPVVPEKKGSMEGRGKRRLLRCVESADMLLYQSQTGQFTVVVNHNLSGDLPDNNRTTALCIDKLLQWSTPSVN